MDTEPLCTLLPKDPERLKELLRRHAVLGIPGIVHDIIADAEQSARIIPAADGLRNVSENIFQEIDVGEVIQIDDAAQLVDIGKFFRRRGNPLPPGPEAQ